MGSTETPEVETILKKLEETLLTRIPLAYKRSPERLFRELSALDLVLGVEEKLRRRAKG